MYMTSDYTKIKEISIVCKCSKEDNKYKELLRVSRGWLSYKKTYQVDDNEDVNWSYKSNSKESFIKFECACDVCYHLFNVRHEHIRVDSPYSFNVRVTYNDLTHIDLKFNGTFADNNLFDYVIMFVKIIPDGEIYPECFTVFKNIYLNKNILRTIEKDNINGLMFAEGGAMGKPGCVELITKDYYRYYTDGIYGKVTDVDQIEVINLLDGFEFKPTFGCKLIENIIINNKEWIYLNLGAGNHLLLRHDLFERIGTLILDTMDHLMYSKWIRLVENKGEY